MSSVRSRIGCGSEVRFDRSLLTDILQLKDATLFSVILVSYACPSCVGGVALTLVLKEITRSPAGEAVDVNPPCALSIRVPPRDWVSHFNSPSTPRTPAGILC
jgi:hypothetical protein